jgi:GAF domain-containing protein
MSQFSIRLIENHIDTTAKIVTVICQHLADYRLSIARDIDEAIREPEPAQVILLDISRLSGNIVDQLAALIRVYGDIPILLLILPGVAASISETLLVEAISGGASDYITLSEAGLLLLGRRLATLNAAWLERLAPPLAPFSLLLAEAITNDTSELAIQLIGANNCVRAWNKANEDFFNVNKGQIIGRSIDELPLSADTISRLKDILDQVRAAGKPFFVPLYTVESRHSSSNWIYVHAYPIHDNLSRSAGKNSVEYLGQRGAAATSVKATTSIDVCLVATRLPEIREIDKKDLDLQILFETSRRISAQLELEPTLETVAEQTKSLLYGDNCQIYFLEKDNQTLRPVYAVGPQFDQIKAAPLRVGQGLIGEIAAHGKAIIDNQVGPKTRIPGFQDKYLLGAPLTALRGVMGVMVISRQKLPFTEDDLHFFESMVQQASAAINNARLFEETRRSLNELATVYEASSAISKHWDDHGVLHTLIQQMVQALNISRGFIASWHKDQNHSSIQAEYINNQTPQNSPKLEPMIELARRSTLLTMINQQRPIVLYLSNPLLDEYERSEMERYNCQARLLIPLVAKGETIGWIELWETQRERAFSADEVRLSRALASQIAIALQNKNYLEQVQRTLEETTALYRVASALTRPQDPQGIISTVLQEYLQVLNLKQGSIIIFDFAEKCGVVKVRAQDNNPIRPPASLAEDETTGQGLGYSLQEGHQVSLQSNPVYERLMRTRQPVVIDDPKAKWLTTPPAFNRSLYIPPVGGWGAPGAFSLLIIPIRIRGEIVGAIIVENTRHNRPFDQWDISTGQAMADQLGVGLQNVQLYEAEYRRREQAETLREVSAIVSSSLNLNEVLERILDQLGRVVKYDSAAIHLIEGDRRRVIAGRGFLHLEQHIGLTFPVKPGADEPGSIAIQQRKPLVFSDIRVKNWASFNEPRHSHIRSWMGIPLIARGKAIGLISIDHSEPDAYKEEAVQLASAFANQVAIALENARLYEIEVRELERELELAQEIQEKLLPQTIPQVPGLDIAGRIVPARHVGGDFFHFFSTEPAQLGVAIGDVSGKGIPAALYMAAAITAIDTQTDPEVTPGELLNKLNTKLYNRLQENRMNIALQIVTFVPLPTENNLKSNQPKASGSLMTAANAGMIAPIGATQHGCRILPVGGLPVGALPPPEYSYTDDIFLLDPFTTIIFTSDGIVEAQNESGELFGFERLEATILEIISAHKAQVITDYIIKTVQKFTGGAEQHDDMTVVVVVKE